MCKAVYPLKETQRVFYGGQCNLLMFSYFDMLYDDIHSIFDLVILKNERFVGIIGCVVG